MKIDALFVAGMTWWPPTKIWKAQAFILKQFRAGRLFNQNSAASLVSKHHHTFPSSRGGKKREQFLFSLFSPRQVITAHNIMRAGLMGRSLITMICSHHQPGMMFVWYLFPSFLIIHIIYSREQPIIYLLLCTNLKLLLIRVNWQSRPYCLVREREFATWDISKHLRESHSNNP